MKRTFFLGALVLLFIPCVIGVLFLVHKKRAPSHLETTLVEELTTLSHGLAKSGFTCNQAGVYSFPKGSRVIILKDLYGESLIVKNRLDALKRRGLLTKDLHLTPNVFLFLNGNCLGESPTAKEVLSILLKLIVNNPQRIFFLRGPYEEMAILKKSGIFGQPMNLPFFQAVQDFFSRLLVCAYIFSEDLTELPLYIVPSGSDAEFFTRIFCEPVVGHEPLRSLCSLGDLCSFEQGPVLTLTAKNYAYAILTIGSTLAKSTVTYVHTQEVVSTQAR